MLAVPDPLVVLYTPRDGIQNDPSPAPRSGWQVCSSLDASSNPLYAWMLHPPVTWNSPINQDCWWMMESGWELLSASSVPLGGCHPAPQTSVCLGGLVGHWPFPLGSRGLPSDIYPCLVAQKLGIQLLLLKTKKKKALSIPAFFSSFVTVSPPTFNQRQRYSLVFIYVFIDVFIDVFIIY